MFDRQFCETLEFVLTQAFVHSLDIRFQNWWCDGVLPPSNDQGITSKYINDHRKVHTKAWVGLNGQQLFDLIIQFGSKAQSRNARGLRFEECITNTSEFLVFEIDLKQKLLVIQLP